MHFYSLLHQLDIRNETAKKYFQYWLGRIQAVEIDEVTKYKNAISKEGKISRNMAVTFLNFKKLGSYCLGEDAIQLNRDMDIKQKSSLENQEKMLLEEKNKNASKIVSTKTINQFINKEYDLEAPKNYSLNQIELYECNDRIQKLEIALEHNNEYLLLIERISEIESKLKALNKSININRQNKFQLESDNNTLTSTCNLFFLFLYTCSCSIPIGNDSSGRLPALYTERERIDRKSTRLNSSHEQ